MMILKGVALVALGIGLFVLATFVFMRVWNWLVPNTFNGPRLGFAQALGLLFLSRMLVGGFGHGGGFGQGHHGGWRQGSHRFFDRDAETGTPCPALKLVPPQKAAPTN